MTVEISDKFVVKKEIDVTVNPTGIIINLDEERDAYEVSKPEDIIHLDEYNLSRDAQDVSLNTHY